MPAAVTSSHAPPNCFACAHTHTRTFPGHSKAQQTHTRTFRADVGWGLSSAPSGTAGFHLWLLLLWLLPLPAAAAAGTVLPREDTNRPTATHSCALLHSYSGKQTDEIVRLYRWGAACSAAFSMDILTTWAVTNPAVARLLWVVALVLATLLVWLFFFCCYSWNQSSSPSLERYLAGMWALKPPPTIPGWVEACDRLTIRLSEVLSSSQARFY